MAIKDIERKMDEFAERVDREAIRVLNYVGVGFQNNARDSVGKSIYGRTVYDHRGQPRARRPGELTANLQNSIGFIVIQDGRETTSDFGSGMGGSQGRKVAREHSISDHGLVMVAGMKYAAAVESKGYDVISNSVNNARKEHEKIMKNVLSAITK